MQLPQYRLNYIKEKKIKDRILLVSLTGAWISLSKEEYNKFRSGKFNEELFSRLEEKEIIVTENNEKKIIDGYKLKKPQLFQGTSLHIVVVTLRCNEKCIYCHAASNPVNTRGVDMDIETARKTVDFIFQSPSRAITIEFQGGEPLLNMPAIKEIISYAKEKNKAAKKDLDFSIVTNLSLMTDDLLEYFIKQEVLGLCTSLDGPKELHDKNRPMLGNSSYDIAVKWIKKIKTDNRIKLNALMSTTRNSLPYSREIVDEYVDLGLNIIWIRSLNNLGTAAAYWNNLSYTAEEFLEFWKKTVDYAYTKGLIEHSSRLLATKILGKKDPMMVDLMSPCGAAIGQMAYYYNGDIYSCDEARMLQEDIFKLGNVFDNNYKEVLTSAKTRSLIAASINDSFFCNTCVYQAYCGLCPVCTYSTTRTIVPKLAADFRCKVLKGQFEHIFNKILFEPDFSDKVLKK
jgi:uncharacterized protein